MFSITLTRCGARALLAAICTSLLAWPPGLRAADDAVHQYVDEITAASITVAVEPLIFARERSDLAANARDYVTLTAVEVNVMGKRSYFWSAYIWSTIDRRDRERVVAPGDELVLVADGRPITLSGDAKTLREHGLGQPPTRAPVRTAVAALYAADLESLGYVGHATQLHIELIHAGSNEAFVLWRDGRATLRTFTEAVGGG